MDGIIKVVQVLLMCLVAGIVLLMLNELFLRNVLDKSFTGMTELAGFMFLWIAFLGILVLFNDDKLIRLDMLYVRMKGKFKTFIWYVQQIVAFALGVTMVASFFGLYPFISTEYYSSMPSFSKMWQYVPMGFCGVFIAVKVICNIVDQIHSTKVGGTV